MKILIASILLQPVAVIAADTNALPKLAPAYPQIPPSFLEQHGTTTLAGSLIFIALAAFLAWQFLKSKPQPVLPPEIIARQTLEKLQGRPEDGKMLSDISQTLRRYISTAFEFPPGELTTTEFSGALSVNKKISAELAQTISSFLRECDERKFSTKTPNTPMSAANRALELVEMVERASSRADSSADSPHPIAK